jgi:hypothetical protein
MPRFYKFKNERGNPGKPDFQQSPIFDTAVTQLLSPKSEETPCCAMQICERIFFAVQHAANGVLGRL